MATWKKWFIPTRQERNWLIGLAIFGTLIAFSILFGPPPPTPEEQARAAAQQQQEKVVVNEKARAEAQKRKDSRQEELWIAESQATVRRKLKDPSSAQFRGVFFKRLEGTPLVCGQVNSKNSYGGYSGYQRFIASGNTLAYLEEEVQDFDNAWRTMCSK